MKRDKTNELFVNKKVDHVFGEISYEFVLYVPCKIWKFLIYRRQVKLFKVASDLQ